MTNSYNKYTLKVQRFYIIKKPNGGILMTWLAWIVLGAMAGWVASMLTGKNSQMGLIRNIIVGIIGALAGSWILGNMGMTQPLTFSINTFLVAVGGAILLLFVFDLLGGTRRR